MLTIAPILVVSHKTIRLKGVNVTTKKKDTVIEDLQKGLNAAAVIALAAATHAVENQHPQFLDEEKAQIIGPLSAALVSKIAVSELLGHLPK